MFKNKKSLFGDGFPFNQNKPKTDTSHPKILGCGTIDGGDYETIEISGSGNVLGNIACINCKVEGNGMFNGDICIENSFAGNGVVTINGNIHSKSNIVTNGALTANNIECELFQVSGSFNNKKLSAKTVRITINGDCNVETINSENLGGCPKTHLSANSAFTPQGGTEEKWSQNAHLHT